MDGQIQQAIEEVWTHHEIDVEETIQESDVNPFILEVLKNLGFNMKLTPHQEMDISVKMQEQEFGMDIAMMTVIIKMVMITSNDSQIKTISENQENATSEFVSNTISYKDGDYKSIEQIQVKDSQIKTITNSHDYAPLESLKQPSYRQSLEQDFTLNNSVQNQAQDLHKNATNSIQIEENNSQEYTNLDNLQNVFVNMQNVEGSQHFMSESSFHHSSPSQTFEIMQHQNPDEQEVSMQTQNELMSQEILKSNSLSVEKVSKQEPLDAKIVALAIQTEVDQSFEEQKADVGSGEEQKNKSPIYILDSIQTPTLEQIPSSDRLKVSKPHQGILKQPNTPNKSLSKRSLVFSNENLQEDIQFQDDDSSEDQCELEARKILQMKLQEEESCHHHDDEDENKPPLESWRNYKLDSDDDSSYRKEDDPTQFWANHHWHTFSKKSIFLLNYNSKLRLRIIKLITHPRFDYLITFLIVVNSFLLGAKDYKDEGNCSYFNMVVEATDPIFMVCFLIEFMLKVCGMGFVLDQGSYLREPWNWLDFIVVVSSLLTEIPSLRSVSGMRTFRLLRPLRTLSSMPSMKILINTLISSVAQLGGVMVLAIFFFMIFAILGVSLWAGSINQRCRLSQLPIDGDWQVDDMDHLLCSSERQCPINRWCGSLAEASRSSDPKYKIELSKIGNIYRDAQIEELNFGFTNFDHLGAAFLTIFQCITLEGWINVTNMFTDAYQLWFVNLYFLSCIIVCSMFVLNLTIAVMLLKYEQFENNDDTSSFNIQLHEYAEVLGLPCKLVAFLLEQKNLSISQSGQEMLEKSVKGETLWDQLMKSSVTFDCEHKYYKASWLTRFCFKLVNSPIFNGFIILIIILNTILLASDQYPLLDNEVLQKLDLLNTIFTIIFTVEVILKIIGLGTKDFVADSFNLFDTLIVLISIIEFLIKLEGKEQGGAIGALRAFRLFRILKIFRTGQLRTLLDCITFTLFSIKDYLVLLILFIYVFALLGMSFFAGKVHFDADNNYVPIERITDCKLQANIEVKDQEAQPPRANFDNLVMASLTVFEVMIGENWNGVMYDHMRSIGSVSAIYFISLIILGNIIMLNLFLAILLGNFDQARSLGEKKKIFYAFKGMFDLGYDVRTSVSLLFDDEDFTKYVEVKLMLNNCVVKPKKKYSDEEIKKVVIAIKGRKLEEILIGEIKLESIDPDQDFCIKEISRTQRQRAEQILKQIDENKEKKQRKKDDIQFEGGLVSQVKSKVKIKLDKSKEESDQEKVKIQIEERDIFPSNENISQQSCFQKVFDHFANSSMFLFGQGSLIRNCCQLCIDKNASIKVNMMENSSLESDPTVSMSQRSVSPSYSSRKTMTFKPKNKSQLMTQKKENIVQKTFDVVILTLIVISSITLIIDNPLVNRDLEYIIFFGYVDNCFTIFFTIEALIKIIALGFILNNSELKRRGLSPYLVDPWNILDLLVVTASLLDFITTIQKSQQDIARQQQELVGAQSSDGFQALKSAVTNQISADQSSKSLQSIKALRALRALRPLRMISRNQGMKLIVNALLESIPNMTNVAIVCCLFLLIFAIVGVDQFKGKFSKCSIEDPEKLAKIFTKEDCLKEGGYWININENFDNVGIGARTLFEMMGTEGWIDVMNNGIDATGVNMQPKQDNNIWLILYFVTFMVFGSQFILNLFVGVIMDNFNIIKDREEWGGLFLTQDQRNWIDAQRLGLVVTLTKNIDPPAGLRGNVFKLVNHSLFDGIITFFIFVNTVMMGAKYDGIDPQTEQIFQKLNYMFAFVFNVEMIIKLIGLDKQYFYSSWNLFDMFIVICTNLGIIMEVAQIGKGFSSASQIIRAFRIMRIIRLVRRQKDVKIILDTLINILPQITNFITLMLLLLFIYAILGINLFSGVVLQDFIIDKNNFQTVGNAMMLLFRCSTGEDWNKIMYEIGLTEDENNLCIPDQDYQMRMNNNGVTRACGYPIFAQVYMISFTFIISWLIMNLSIAAVIEGLDDAQKLNNGFINKGDLEQFLQGWIQYDPQATGWISSLDLIILLIELPPPFGRKKFTKKCHYPVKSTFNEARNRIYNMNSYYVNEKKQIIIKHSYTIKALEYLDLKQYVGNESQLHFKDVYQSLIRGVCQEHQHNFELSDYLLVKQEKEWITKFHEIKNLPISEYLAHEIYAQVRMINQFRYIKILKEKREHDAEMEKQEITSRSYNIQAKTISECDPSSAEGNLIIREDPQLSSMMRKSQKQFKIGFSDRDLSQLENSQTQIGCQSRDFMFQSKNDQRLRLPPIDDQIQLVQLSQLALRKGRRNNESVVRTFQPVSNSVSYESKAKMNSPFNAFKQQDPQQINYFN